MRLREGLSPGIREFSTTMAKMLRRDEGGEGLGGERKCGVGEAEGN